jgi:hypothetical protein
MPTIARTAASITGLTAVFLLVLYLACDSGNGEDSTPTLTASAGVSPSATPSPAVTDTPPIATPTATPPGSDLMEAAGESSFPDDVALIVQTGCWQCDGPPSGLRRMYVGPDGAIRSDTLLSVDQLGISPIYVEGPYGPQQVGPYITGMAISDDASEMFVSVCIADACGSGALFSWSADAAVRGFHSTDGGITWRSLGDFDGGLSLFAPLGSGSALVYWYEEPVSHGSKQPQFAAFPSMRSVAPPGVNPFPVFTIRQEIVWRDFDETPLRLLRSDGSTFVDLADSGYVRYFPGRSFAPDSLIPVQWYPYDAQPQDFVTFLQTSGEVAGTLRLPYPFSGGFRMDESRMLVSVPAPPGEFGIDTEVDVRGSLPAIVDLESRTMSAIFEHVRQGVRPQGDTLLAIQRGPSARVVNPAPASTSANTQTPPPRSSPAPQTAFCCGMTSR